MAANQLVPIDYKLTSEIAMEAINGNSPPGGFYMDASADFGNTITLMVDDFNYFDSDMNPISASFQVVSIPEPNAFLMMGLLFGGIVTVRGACKRWRGKHRVA